MSEYEFVKINDTPKAILSMRLDGFRITVCPDCWTRDELVPIVLEVGGTLAFVLPDQTEVQRLAGSYRFCTRCSWSQTTGHMASPPQADSDRSES